MSGVIRGNRGIPARTSQAPAFDITNPPAWMPAIWRLAEAGASRGEIEREVARCHEAAALRERATAVHDLLDWEADVSDRHAAGLTLAYVGAALEEARGAALYSDCRTRWHEAAHGAFLALGLAHSIELPMPGAIFTSAALRTYGTLLSPWQLPRCVDEPVRCFKRPFGAGAYFLAAAVIHVGDRLAASDDWQAATDRIHPKVIDLLGIDESRLSSVRDDFESRGQAIRRFRSLLP